MNQPLVLVVSDADPLRADLSLRALLTYNAHINARVGALCLAEDAARATAHRTLEMDYPGLALWHAADPGSGLLDAVRDASHVLFLRESSLCLSELDLPALCAEVPKGHWACLDREPSTRAATALVCGDALRALVAEQSAFESVDALLVSLPRVVVKAKTGSFVKLDVVSEDGQSLSPELSTAMFIAGLRGLIPDASNLTGDTAFAHLGAVENWPMLPSLVA